MCIGAEGIGALSRGRAHPSSNVVLASLQGPVRPKALSVCSLAESIVGICSLWFQIILCWTCTYFLFSSGRFMVQVPHRSDIPPGLIVLVVFHLSES